MRFRRGKRVEPKGNEGGWKENRSEIKKSSVIEGRGRRRVTLREGYKTLILMEKRVRLRRTFRE